MDSEERVLLGGVFGIVGVAILGVGICSSIETVSTGYRAVGMKFGDVTGTVLDAGFHFTNPLLSWDYFSIQDQSYAFEDIEVSASDQQKATMDISVQASIRPEAVVEMRRVAGSEKRAVEVNFTPYVRGALRDAGRSTRRVEDFYDQATVSKYEQDALAQIRAQVESRGFEVSAVIVRDVDLPPVIAKAIENKKQREQEVEQERATLLQVELKTQQQVKEAESQKKATILRAEAEKESAALKAEAVRVAADAEAYKIQRLQAQLRESPNYVELVKAEKWNGELPRFSGGGAIPFLNLSEGK